MSSFDLVVTVALGSTLASVLTTRTVTLIQAVTAFAVLISLQFVLAFLVSRSRRAQLLVKAEPRLLAYRGRPLHEALRKERVAESELEAAARQAGLGSVADAEAIVLEADASLSVIRMGERESEDFLRHVKGREGADPSVLD